MWGKLGAEDMRRVMVVGGTAAKVDSGEVTRCKGVEGAERRMECLGEVRGARSILGDELAAEELHPYHGKLCS